MTGPPVKKRKAEPAGNAFDVRGESESLISKFTTMLDAMEEKFDPSKSNSSEQLFMDASMAILSLKSLQRRVLDQIDAAQRTLAEQKQRRDAQELKLENLLYQKQLHEHSIHSYRQLESPQLEQLCRSEADRMKRSEESRDNTTNDEKDTKKITREDTDALLKSFLGADPKDPLQRSVIVAKLNEQLGTRKRLENELKNSEQKAANLKKLVTSKRKLLNELPMKLADMERASLPLQKFCQKSMGASRLLGTERRKRLDLSQSLPKPLYTLFYQLQSALDNMELSGELAALQTEDAPSLEVDKDATKILLTLPIPHITDRPNATVSGFGGGKKKAVVSFEYHTALNVVTACCSKDHDMGDLLRELFPNDSGDWEEHAYDEDEAGGEEDEAINQLASLEKAGKRPYNWCNYLSGLHLLPHEKGSQVEARISSLVVIKAILRRVRAHATLHWVLNALSRKPNPFPVHPSMKDSFLREDSGVRLTAWSQQPSTASESPSWKEQVFVASLKRKAATLSLRVRIQPARYPSVPPTWEFSTNTEHCSREPSLVENDSSLYDDVLVGIERHVNQDVEGLILPANEATYDWILSHQLSQIAIKWEEHLVGNTK